VSNFGKPGFYSRHNTSYWQGIPYVALGPSAHGFDGNSRYWNVANNMKYINAIEEGVLPQSVEVLSKTDEHNEWLMTGLRTRWGVNLIRGKENFGIDHRIESGSYLNKLVAEGLAIFQDDHLILTKEGLFRADGIASDLFIVDEE
jgi:oxygen-independent coproporphyrinogen-3 oxidase